MGDARLRRRTAARGEDHERPRQPPARKRRQPRSQVFLEITTDAEFKGVSGELFLDTPKRLDEIAPRLGQLLVSRDPQSRDWQARNKLTRTGDFAKVSVSR